MPPHASTSKLTLPSWFVAEPNKERDREAAQRKARRAAKVAERTARFDDLKNKGNDAFKQADYRRAHDLYHEAIKFAGDTGNTRKKAALPAWLNVIQVYMKTNMPDLAQTAATAALSIEPRNVKARYRRGLARRDLNLLHAAILDFEAVLKVDPHLQEARMELDAARTRWNSGEGFRTVHTEAEDAAPGIDEAPLSDDEDSDSSDARHTGNGTPCREYNYSRCRHGARACAFSHAPDISAERDSLGRNVCKNFLIGRCKYGLERCYFSHSKAYLPSGIKEGKKPKWWETRDSLDEARELYDLWQDRRAAKEAGGFQDAGSEEWDDSDDEDDGFDGDIDPEQAVEELFRDLRKTKNEAIARGAAAPGWQNSGSARRTGQERGSELVDLLKRELDLGYTEAEFEHLCVNGVNPYTDYPEDIRRAMATFDPSA